MKIESWSFRRCARKSGGLHAGIFFHFPTSISSPRSSEDDDPWNVYHEYWTNVSLTIGFVFWQLSIHFGYDYRRRYLRESLRASRASFRNDA